MEVYHKPEACFKLEANASKRQQWQPGEVVITKLKKRFFPYLFASGLDPPPYNVLALPVADSGLRPIATSAQR